MQHLRVDNDLPANVQTAPDVRSRNRRRTRLDRLRPATPSEVAPTPLPSVVLPQRLVCAIGRVLDRAAQTAGRSDDQRLNELGAVLRAIIVGRAQAVATQAFRGDDKTPQPPDLDAAALGLAALLVDRGAQTMKVEVSRRTWAGLARATMSETSSQPTNEAIVLAPHPTHRAAYAPTSAIQGAYPRASHCLIETALGDATLAEIERRLDDNADHEED